MLLLQLQVRLALEHRVVLVLQLSRVVEEEAFHLRLAEEALEGVLVQREAVLPPVATALGAEIFEAAAAL